MYMKKRYQRILAILLSLAMCLNLIPATVFATELDTAAETVVSEDTSDVESDTNEEETTEAVGTEAADEETTVEVVEMEDESEESLEEVVNIKERQDTSEDSQSSVEEADEINNEKDESNTSNDNKEISGEVSNETLLASTSSYEPYANIEYGYTSSVACGTIRYISQVANGANFHSQYWGSWASQANIECGTSSISMALSYIGINKTPQNILDEGNGITYFGKNWGGSTYSNPSVATGVSNYINGNGKYSPVVIHIPKYSSAGHYVVIAGRISTNVYQILDPWENSVTRMTINGTTATYTKSGSTITDTIDSIYQWYNPSASLSKEITISGQNSPGTITQGNSFSISGTISSGATLTNVTVGCYDVNGTMKIGKSVNPGSTSYNIQNIDNDIVFGNLAPGVYCYKVMATNSGGTKTLVEKVFIVLATGNTISQGTYVIETSYNSSLSIDIADHSSSSGGECSTG